MTLKVSQRGSIPPFLVMDIMAAANAHQAKGNDVLHLEVGQPSTAAPAAVLDAAQRALRDNILGYTDALGLPILREAIAQHYHDQYRITIQPDSIVVTSGSSGAFVLTFLAVFDVGDRVAVVTPGYPAYRNILTSLGINCIELQANAQNRYQPNIAQVEELINDIEGLIIASPSNPTGSMLTAGDLKYLAAICEANQIRLISDEIYHGITYGTAASTALAFSENAVIVNSFSKYFSMTGWRVGWMVIPPQLLRPIECLAQNLFISPPALSQHAALAAFECKNELDAHVKRYTRNRKLLLDGLPKARFKSLSPSDGAFYIYANVENLTDNSPRFCASMLEETNVSTTPGVDFDCSRGNHFIRFSFSGNSDEIAEAIQRLRHWRG